jgi:hypothetical protein
MSPSRQLIDCSSITRTLSRRRPLDVGLPLELPKECPASASVVGSSFFKGLFGGERFGCIRTGCSRARRWLNHGTGTVIAAAAVAVAPR